MKILFIGDIVGDAGIKAVKVLLPELLVEYEPDCVIANAENASGGFGLNKQTAKKLFEYGIGVLTSGNHIWDKKNIFSFMDDEPRLLRPANYPPGVPGRGRVVLPVGGQHRLGILNLSGRVFMEPLDCPFRAAESEIAALEEDTRCILVDIHAEATSEKQALGWMLDGRVSAVCGTHTHVQTADETILPGGTAYITDVGMSGAFASVIGVERDIAIKRFQTQLPISFKTAEKDIRLNGFLVEIDPDTGKALRCERIQRRR